jgi:Ca2+-transporting ATPase
MPRSEHVTGSAVDAGVAPLARLVHSAVPGRGRFEIAGLYHDDALAQLLPGRLRRRSGIFSASASPLTGRLLVLFDPGLDPAQVQAWIEETLAGLTQGNGKSRKAGAAAQGDRAGMPEEDQSKWHRLPVERALGLLDSPPETGLSPAEAARRLERCGPNRLPSVPARSGLEILIEQFNSLPVALLGISAVLSLATGGVLEAVAIGCVVGLNAVIGYATESEAERTINALTQDEPLPATVIRSGRRRQIPIEEVVPGDVVALTRAWSSRPTPA